LNTSSSKNIMIKKGSLSHKIVSSVGTQHHLTRVVSPCKLSSAIHAKSYHHHHRHHHYSHDGRLSALSKPSLLHIHRNDHFKSTSITTSKIILRSKYIEVKPQNFIMSNPAHQIPQIIQEAKKSDSFVDTNGDTIRKLSHFSFVDPNYSHSSSVNTGGDDSVKTVEPVTSPSGSLLRVELRDRAIELLTQKVIDQEANVSHHEGTEKYGVYLSGPIGSGKTQLMQQVADRLFEEGWAVVRLPDMRTWTMKQFSSPSDACKYFIWYMKQQFGSGGSFFGGKSVAKFHKTDPLPEWWHRILDNPSGVNESSVVKQLFNELEQYTAHRLLVICDDHHLLYTKHRIPVNSGVIDNCFFALYPFMELIFPGSRFKRGALLISGEQTTDSFKNAVVGVKQKFSYVYVNRLNDIEWNNLLSTNETARKLLCLDSEKNRQLNHDIELELKELTNGFVGSVEVICNEIAKRLEEQNKFPKMFKTMLSKVVKQTPESNPELVRSVLSDYRREKQSSYTERLNSEILTLFPHPAKNTVKSFWAIRNEYLRDTTKFYEQLFYYLVPLYNPDPLLKEVRRNEMLDSKSDFKLFRNTNMEKVLLRKGLIYVDANGNYLPTNSIAHQAVFEVMVNSLYRLKFNYNAQRTRDLQFIDSPKEMYSRKKGAIIRELSRRVLEFNTHPSVYEHVDLMKQLFLECKASSKMDETITMTHIPKSGKEEFALLTDEEMERRERDIATFLMGEQMFENGRNAAQMDEAYEKRREMFVSKFGSLPKEIFEDTLNIPVMLNEPNPLTTLHVISLNRDKRARINLLKAHKDEYDPAQKMTTPVTVHKLTADQTVEQYLQTIPQSSDNNLDIQLIVPYSTRIKGDIDLIIATRKNSPDQKWNAIFVKVINLEEFSEMTTKDVHISKRYHTDLAQSTNKQGIFENGYLVLLSFDEKPPADKEYAVKVDVESPGINLSNVWLSYKEDYMRDDLVNIKNYFPEISRRRKVIVAQNTIAGDDPNEDFIENAMLQMGSKKKFGADWELRL